MIRRTAILISLLFAALIQCLNAQTTAFNYQGRLTDGGNPASGAFQISPSVISSLELEHRPCPFFVRDRVTDPPAGHRVCFRKAAADTDKLAKKFVSR